MKNENYYIIGGAALLGGLFYAYKKGLFGKKIPLAQEDANKDFIDNAIDKSAKITTETKQVAKAIKNTSVDMIKAAYKRKVEALQVLLKVGVDGDAGKSADSQTNKALALTYGLDKGIVSLLNIDYYLKKVQSGLTLIKQNLIKQSTISSDTILKAVKNGGKVVFLKDFLSNFLYYDKSKNSYVGTGKTYQWKKGNNIDSGWRILKRTKSSILVNKGKDFIEIPISVIAVI